MNIMLASVTEALAGDRERKSYGATRRQQIGSSGRVSMMSGIGA